ncbi:MAG: sodium:solute symporter [Gammaproteobacteria bacterium]|nr:MAG: sodium:solute symporter [Gammaproteobacteria bacterium]
MDKSVLVLSEGLTQGLGYALMIGFGLLFLILAFVIKRRLIRSTHDFVIANRKVGLGFGVGSVISVWTWAMAVMMSSAMTYQWGLSGLFWFVVPNGFAIMAMVPLARILRRKMPEGYTISQFAHTRFNGSKVASIVVTIAMIFGILLETLINIKGTSVVMSTVFPIAWETVVILTVVVVMTYVFFGGLWTSVMTGTFNTWMITTPAAIVVVAVYAHISGGATAVFEAVKSADASNLSVFEADAAAGFGITLAFGLLAAVVADQTFWQKVWAVRKEQVTRTFLWGGALFYPIPICLGMLGLAGLAFGVTPEEIGGDIVAIGPYMVSHIGLPLILIVAYVLVILAACYSTIDGAASALSSIIAIDIIKRFNTQTKEATLFYITRFGMILGGVISGVIVLTGVDFTTLVLTTYALKTSILLPLILAIVWNKTSVLGFVGGIVLSIAIGMPLRHLYGEMVGTFSILAISAGVVILASLLTKQKFDMNKLLEAHKDELAHDKSS